MVLVRLRSTERRRNSARSIIASASAGALMCAAATLALLACISLYGCAASSPPPSLSRQVASQATSATSSLSPQAELTILAEQASGHLLGNIQAVYQQPAEKALITGTVSNAVPRTPAQISAAQEKVKMLCFQVQRALWSSGISLQEITVTILGPVFDDYFDQIISWYGTASLEAGAAAQVDWRNLTVDAAWNRFQRTQLRVDFGSFQLYGTTPVPTTSALPGGP
jgi:hypothetical protein